MGKFNWETLFKVIVAIVSVLLGANQYGEHKEHKGMQQEIQDYSGR